MPWGRKRSLCDLGLRDHVAANGVDTVIPYYLRWIKISYCVCSGFASEEGVLLLWEGWDTMPVSGTCTLLQKIVQHCTVSSPHPDELQELPGIGEYTANAIASICFDFRCCVDANINVYWRAWSIWMNRLRTRRR
jgi:A/G-specific adenine glycosylase